MPKSFMIFLKIHFFTLFFLLPPQENDECIYSSVWSRIYEVFQVQVAIVTVALLWRGKIMSLQILAILKDIIRSQFQIEILLKILPGGAMKIPETHTRILIAHKCTSISFIFTGLCRDQKLLSKFVLQLCAIKPILTRSPLSKIFPGISFYFNRDWDFERRKLVACKM